MGRGLLVGEGLLPEEYPGAVPLMAKPGTAVVPLDVRFEIKLTAATEGSAIGYAREEGLPACATGALRSHQMAGEDFQVEGGAKFVSEKLPVTMSVSE
jgi:hypothetical protein